MFDKITPHSILGMNLHSLIHHYPHFLNAIGTYQHRPFIQRVPPSGDDFAGFTFEVEGPLTVIRDISYFPNTLGFCYTGQCELSKIITGMPLLSSPLHRV